MAQYGTVSKLRCNGAARSACLVQAPMQAVPQAPLEGHHFFSRIRMADQHPDDQKAFRK